MEEIIEKKQLFTKNRLIIILGVLLVLAIGSSAYFYKKLNSDPQKEAQAELDKVIRLVGRHMVLPTGETPTMATVSDPEKLRDQPFFTNAKKGDNVLIFVASKKAILYDPELDRIIEVAPVNSKTN